MAPHIFIVRYIFDLIEMVVIQYYRGLENTSLDQYRMGFVRGKQ